MNTMLINELLGVLSVIQKKGFSVNPNGHALGDWPVHISAINLMCLSDESLSELIAAFKSGELPLSHPVRLGGLIDLTECYYCGVRPECETDGVSIRVVMPCEKPEGLRLEFELAIPSGAMVVSDDLRPIYDAGCLKANTALAQVELSLASAALGCAYGGVGNTSPGVYRVDEDHYLIASPGWSDVDSDLIDGEIPPPGEYLAQVITDLWAYSIADEADYLTKGGADNPHWTHRIPVKPGVYRFRHHMFERDFDPDDTSLPAIYAEFEWVRPV